MWTLDQSVLREVRMRHQPGEERRAAGEDGDLLPLDRFQHAARAGSARGSPACRGNSRRGTGPSPWRRNGTAASRTGSARGPSRSASSAFALRHVAGDRAMREVHALRPCRWCPRCTAAGEAIRGLEASSDFHSQRKRNSRQNRCRRGIRDDLVDLALRVQRIERHELRARGQHAEHGDAGFDRVGQERGDALAFELPANPLPQAKYSRVADAALAADQRLAVRSRRRRRGEHVHDRRVAHSAVRPARPR